MDLLDAIRGVGKYGVKLLRATDALVADLNTLARAIRTGTSVGAMAAEER